MKENPDYWDNVSEHVRAANSLFLSGDEVTRLIFAAMTATGSVPSNRLGMTILEWAMNARFDESMLFLTLDGYMLPYDNRHEKLAFRSVDGTLSATEALEYRIALAEIMIDQRICEHCLVDQAAVAQFQMLSNPEVQRLELAAETALRFGATGFTPEDVIRWSIRVRTAVGRLQGILTERLLVALDENGELEFRDIDAFPEDWRNRYHEELAPHVLEGTEAVRSTLIARPMQFSCPDSDEWGPEDDPWSSPQ